MTLSSQVAYHAVNRTQSASCSRTLWPMEQPDSQVDVTGFWMVRRTN